MEKLNLQDLRRKCSWIKLNTTEKTGLNEMFNPVFGARVGYAFPLSLTVYSSCYVFVWLAVELGRFSTPPSRPETDYFVNIFSRGKLCGIIKKTNQGLWGKQ